MQRYAQTWSGDNRSSWETLKYNIPMGLGLSLSGMSCTGHDIGGFTGFAPSPELFVRWVQNAALQPRFAMNSWHLDGSVNEPWMYLEILPIIREWFEFRYRLMPYLYSLYFEAMETGHPIIRPMVYEFPFDERCLTESFDYMLGPNLLVASVFEEGARTRRVYLPSKEEWCDFYSGEWHHGGQAIEVDAPLERNPLLVRAGGMIPMGKAMKHVGAEPDDVRQVYVFPHPTQGHGEFTLIEDDGITLDYQQGKYTKVQLHLESNRNSISVNAQTSGNYRLPYKNIEFILPRGETRRIDSRGDEWMDSNQQRHFRLEI
jgi:alpha-glucosidase